MPADRRKVGRRSKEKGKGYERKIACLFGDWCGDRKSFGRRWSGRAETPEGGDLLTPDWFPFPIECRHRESWSWRDLFRKHEDSILVKWWDEMVEKNKTEDILLVFTKDNRPDYVMFNHEWLREQIVHKMESYMTVVRQKYSQLTIVELTAFLKHVSPEVMKSIFRVA